MYLFKLDLYPQPVFIIYWDFFFSMLIKILDKNWLDKRRAVSLLEVKYVWFFWEQITEGVSIWACNKLCGHSDQTQPSQADTKLSDLVVLFYGNLEHLRIQYRYLGIKIYKYIQTKTEAFVLYLIFKIVKIASRNCQTFYNFKIELRSPVAVWS